MAPPAKSSGRGGSAVKLPRLADDFAHFDVVRSGPRRPKRAPLDGDAAAAAAADAETSALLDARLGQLLQAPLASVRVDVLKSQCLMLDGKERRKVRARLLVAMGARTAKRRPVAYARLQGERAEAKVRERHEKAAERARVRIVAGKSRGPARRKKARRTIGGAAKVEKIRHVNAGRGGGGSGGGRGRGKR